MKPLSRRLRATAALVVPVALLATACSSGSSGSSGGGLLGGGGSTPSSSSSSGGGSSGGSSGGSTGGGTSTTFKQLTQPQLQSALLTASDLPGGDWTDNSSGPDNSTSTTSNPACTTLANSDQAPSGSVRVEADFAGSGGTDAYNLLLLQFPSVSAAKSQMNALKSALANCTTTTTVSSSDGSTAQAQFAKASTPSIGDEQVGIALRITENGQQGSGAMVMIREGATFVGVETIAQGWSDPQPDVGVVKSAVQKYTQAAS